MLHYGHFSIPACTHLAAAAEGIKPSLKSKTDACTVQGSKSACHDQQRGIPKELGGPPTSKGIPTKKHNKARNGKQRGKRELGDLEGGEEVSPRKATSTKQRRKRDLSDLEGGEEVSPRKATPTKQTGKRDLSSGSFRPRPQIV